MKLDGKLLAQELLEKQRIEAGRLKKQGITPHLAVILVGNDPASQAYVRQKKLKGETIGMIVSIHHFDDNVSQKELLETIKTLNSDANVHGIIIQQPLPKDIDPHVLVSATDPQKDVDGFHPQSTFTPPIAEAVMEILDRILSLHLKGVKLHLSGWLKSKNIVVIGKGETGGAPIITKLQKLGVKPTIIDSKTHNPQNITKNADIIISCVGRSGIVKSDAIKKGVILLSIGMYRGEDGKLHGDYEEDDINDIASFYTPVPGGVGPVNVAMLLQNVLVSAKNSIK